MSYWKFGDKYAGVTPRGKRFVVDTRSKAIEKAGKKSKGKSSGKSKTSKSRTTKRSTPKMSKTKNSRRSYLSSRTIFSIVRIGALVAPAASVAMEEGLTGQQKLNKGLKFYTGWDMENQEFNFAAMANGYLPYLATSVVTKGIGKLLGMIRRL